MRLFIDTAKLEDIEWGLKTGAMRGITTNPSLLAKEPKGNYLVHLGKIVELIKQHVPLENRKGFSLSVEVFSDEPDEILAQAREFVEKLQWPALAVKVHIDHRGRDNLGLINQLSRSGISVNCTACMTVYQAMTAAAAGARYVSLLWGRIRDGGSEEKFAKEREELIASGKLRKEDFDPAVAVKETRILLERFYPKSKIIAGSVRTPSDVKDASLAGAHIVTVQPKVLREMFGHFKTDEIVDQFFSDFKAWSN